MFLEVLAQNSGDICLPFPTVVALAIAIAGGFVYMQKQKDAAVNRMLEFLEKELEKREQ